MNLLDEVHLDLGADYYARVERQVERLAREPDFALSGEVMPAAFALHFLPHLCRRPFGAFHHASFARYERLVRDAASPLTRVGRAMALAAPRGSAKSSVHTLILPLMDICLRRERYIVIVSATSVQAEIRLHNIKRELAYNRRLREVFGDALKPQRPWTRSSICVNDVRVDAFGALAEIRGISHGEARPTKIILDDAESSRRALTNEGRVEVQQWYDEVIENLGDSYTQLEVVGTILHRDSLLSRLLKRTGFDHALTQSVVQWSPAQEMWQEWQRMFLNIADENREDTAAEFLDANQEVMLNGTQVLWEERETYVDLMKQLATRGRAAFFKEKQNTPLKSDEVLFNPAQWKWFRTLPNGDLHLVEDRAAKTQGGATAQVLNWKRDLTIYGFLDPAGGEHYNRGDFAAVVTVGRHRSGATYVLEVWMKRVPANAQVDYVMQMHRRFGYKRFWFEVNGNQGAFYENLFSGARTAERKANTHLLDLPFARHHQTGKSMTVFMRCFLLYRAGTCCLMCECRRNSWYRRKSIRRVTTMDWMRWRRAWTGSRVMKWRSKRFCGWVGLRPRLRRRINVGCRGKSVDRMFRNVRFVLFEGAERVAG